MMKWGNRTEAGTAAIAKPSLRPSFKRDRAHMAAGLPFAVVQLTKQQSPSGSSVPINAGVAALMEAALPSTIALQPTSSAYQRIDD